MSTDIKKLNTVGKLKTHHVMAIELIMEGKTDEEVAAAVDVSRETVTRWRNGNCYFQAELNKRREAQWEVAQDRLRSLIGIAIDNIERNLLEEGDFKASMELLKVIGVNGVTKPSVGETDPRLVIVSEAERKSRVISDKMFKDKSQRQKELIQQFIREKIDLSSEDEK